MQALAGDLKDHYFLYNYDIRAGELFDLVISSICVNDKPINHHSVTNIFAKATAIIYDSGLSIRYLRIVSRLDTKQHRAVG